MRLILTGSTDPYFNLASEEWWLNHSEEDVFMLWQNDNTIVIGKNQNLYAEVDLVEAEKQRVVISRRITGGGAVYHDLGNVNYTFITSKEKANVLDFDYFTRPVRKALSDLGVDAVLSGRNDLLVRSGEAEEYRKCSGNAMTATKTRILSHGTLLFDSDMAVLSKVLKPDEEKLRKKAVKSVRSRVTNIRPLLSGAYEAMTTEAFFEFLVRFAEEEFGCTREMIDRKNVEESGIPARNASEDYIFGRKTHFDHMVRNRFDAGLVVMNWNVREGIVRDVSFEGDFFGEEDVRILEEFLEGVPQENLIEKTRSFPAERCVSGVSGDDLAEMLRKYYND